MISVILLLKMAGFRDVTQRSMAFKGIYCLHHQGNRQMSPTLLLLLPLLYFLTAVRCNGDFGPSAAR
jgi:hypothetical protein